jgi:hypothetical protein
MYTQQQNAQELPSNASSMQCQVPYYTRFQITTAVLSEDSGFLGRKAAKLGEWLPTFRRIVKSLSTRPAT